MKRSRKLIIMLAALVVACGGYYLAIKLNETEAARQTEAEVSLVTGEVTGLGWTYEGESLELVNVDGTWILNGDEACPVDQDVASEMAETLAGYTAQATIDGNISLADYGLDEPVAEAAVTTADGETVFMQGGENPLTGQVYIMKAGDESMVYAADESIEDLFSVSTMDLVVIEEMPTIGDAGTLFITDRVDITRDENGVWRTAQGERTDETAVEALFDAVREVTWQSLADWKGEIEMENPVSVSCAWDGGEFEILIGEATDDGYLAKIPDSNITYVIDAANAEVILNASYDSLRSTALFDADWDAEYTISASIGENEYVPSEEAIELIKEIETGDLAQATGREKVIIIVNGVECTISDYDADNCTATVNGVTRLIPADEADRLTRLIQFSPAPEAEQPDEESEAAQDDAADQQSEATSAQDATQSAQNSADTQSEPGEIATTDTVE
ncbi:MAG: DUF4340 domain-containing protein [Clostridia bacterium]|nr:DUF4340 domain-containing protein [Clostridia bacterium]